MSEFQSYEFVAIDRPLSDAEQRRLRAITSRATITSTRLANTYEWGDFNGDPHELVAKYFDAFLYYANWGTRRLILRIPSARLDLKTAKQYCRLRGPRSRSAGSVATVAQIGKHLVFDFWSENESADDGDEIEPGALVALVPIRNELMDGDHRALHLALQLRRQAGEATASVRPHPGVHAKRGASGSQQALAEFLRIEPT